MFIFGVIFALVAGILFGLIGPTTKIAYNFGASASLAILFRYVVATIFILPFIPFQKNLLKTYQKNIISFLLISLGSILLTSGLLISFNYINVSLAVLIFCLYPIYVLIYSVLVDKEEINIIVKFLFFSTFIGIFLVLGPSLRIVNLIGIIFAVIASIGATSMIIINQKMSRKGIPPIPINIFINIINTIFFFLIIKVFFSLNINYDFNIYLFIFIPSACYCLAFLSQLYAIPRIGQSNTALFLYLEPVVGVLGAVYFLDEILTFSQLVGAVVVIISLLLATYYTNKTKNVVS
ncbi:DMT family transporter [Pelagibacteraceae bacterium]|nr:DMT family transporter [Pelagibacteraceae bacterium]